MPPSSDHSQTLRRFREDQLKGPCTKATFSICSKQRVLFVGGLICIALGLSFGLARHSIIQSHIVKSLILHNTSGTYEGFKETQIPIYLKLHFWNWTNPSNLKEPGYKPKFVQMGPYTYREVTEKADIVWNSNGTVSFKKLRYWYFEPDMTNGSLDDLVTTINVVSKSAAFITRNDNAATRLALNMALLTTQSISVRKPVREMLFEGYRNTLIDAASAVNIFGGLDVPFDRFGWFYKRNGTKDFDGIFNVETGANGIEHFGKLRSWNHQNQTTYYDGPCGTVAGSGGDFFPPFRTKNDELEFFASDICRTVPFVYTEEVKKYDIPLFKYKMHPKVFDNGATDNSTTCFCSGECAPPGAINVSSCRLGAPAFVSFPHFLNADPSYINNVEGMRPDPNLHEPFILMEPTYAIPFTVSIRLQMNILVQPFSDIGMYNGVQRVFFPMVWFEQTGSIPEEMAQAIKMVTSIPNTVLIASLILMSIGLLLIIATAIIGRQGKKKHTYLKQEYHQVVEPMIHGKDLTEQNVRRNTSI